MILLVAESSNTIGRNADDIVGSLFQDNDESFLHNVSGTRLELSDFKSITEGGRFYCEVGNVVGTSSTSNAGVVIVESRFGFGFVFHIVSHCT